MGKFTKEKGSPDFRGNGIRVDNSKNSSKNISETCGISPWSVMQKFTYFPAIKKLKGATPARRVRIFPLFICHEKWSKNFWRFLSRKMYYFRATCMPRAKICSKRRFCDIAAATSVLMQISKGKSKKFWFEGKYRYEIFGLQSFTLCLTFLHFLSLSFLFTRVATNFRVFDKRMPNIIPKSTFFTFSSDVFWKFYDHILHPGLWTRISTRRPTLKKIDSSAKSILSSVRY